MGHVVLDLTSLTYQSTTKSSNRSGHPKKQLIFAMSQRKPAYPAHAPDMHENEDEDDKPLVRTTTRKEPHEEGRDQSIDDEDLARLVIPRLRDLLRTATEEKGISRVAGSSHFTGTRVSKGLVRIAAFSSAIVIDVIVHCHTAGAF